MEVRRFAHPSQVPEFVEQSLKVWGHSWKEQIVGGTSETRRRWEQSLGDLAERGILRAYMLDCGGQPYAFAVGYQHDGVYHYVEPGYDARFSSFAPGIVLLMLLMEDLINFNRPRVLDFGADDLEFKRLFSNESVEDAQVVLFRNTAANCLRWIMHSVFRRGIRFARQIAGRKTTE